jgi:cytidine deaminase
MDKTITIHYQEYGSVEELTADDAALMRKAMEAAGGAYAPYSHFHVGAALRLDDGSIVVGNNQENAAYPSGLCAERTALFAASAQRPDCRRYRALAIVGHDGDGYCEASPCGACRQVMAEYERRQDFPMRVLCYLQGGGVRAFSSVADLLPFGFIF